MTGELNTVPDATLFQTPVLTAAFKVADPTVDVQPNLSLNDAFTPNASTPVSAMGPEIRARLDQVIEAKNSIELPDAEVTQQAGQKMASFSSDNRAAALQDQANTVESRLPETPKTSVLGDCLDYACDAASKAAVQQPEEEFVIATPEIEPEPVIQKDWTPTLTMGRPF